MMPMAVERKRTGMTSQSVGFSLAWPRPRKKEKNETATATIGEAGTREEKKEKRRGSEVAEALHEHAALGAAGGGAVGNPAAGRDAEHRGDLQHEGSGKARGAERHVESFPEEERQPVEEDPNAHARQHGLGEQHMIRRHAEQITRGLGKRGPRRGGGGLGDGRRAIGHGETGRERECDADEAEDDKAGAPAEMFGEVAGARTAEHDAEVQAERVNAHRARPRVSGPW
jgi:hypothetical protein